MKANSPGRARGRPPSPTRDEVLAELKARSDAWGIENGYARRLAEVESSLNPILGANSAGAVGLMQVKPSTAAEMSRMPPARPLDVYDWRDNIEASMRYARRLRDQFQGNRAMAAAAYNFGETGARRGAFEGGVPPARTWAYVSKVLPDWSPLTPEGPKSDYPPTVPPGLPTLTAPPQPTWEWLTKDHGLFGPLDSWIASLRR